MKKYNSRYLKRIFLSLLSFLYVSNEPAFSQAPGISFAEMISVDSLKNIVYHLSSDDMGGRNAGSTQSAQAAIYIAQKFQNSGVLQLESGYMQPFAQTGTPKNRYYTGKTLTINKKSFRFSKDFYLPQEYQHQKPLRISQIIFMPGDRYQPGQSINPVEGKAVLLLHGPDGKSDSSIKAIISGYNKAKSLGAKAVLIPSLHFNDTSLNDEQDFAELYQRIPKDQRKIPLIVISWKIVAAITGQSDISKLISEAENGKLQQYDINGKLKLTWHPAAFQGSYVNVLGFIPGKQPGNFLVIGAHYDHVGETHEGIYHGADDNASGIAGLLEMARCFAIALKSGYTPQRSTAFVAFDAEEEGLLGSKAFIRSIGNKDSIFAMLNMDMIGRRESEKERQDKIYVLGYDENSKGWKNILSEARKQLPDLRLDLTYSRNFDPEMLLQRSDQYPFLEEGIPALFFFDNMKEDYHKPSDTAEKIDYPLLKKRAKFIFLTAWELVFGEYPKFRK